MIIIIPASVGCNADTSCRRRKYAWWCCGCGALAAALGGLLAAQHILVRAYTASPHHLETVPAAVPAAMVLYTLVERTSWCAPTPPPRTTWRRCRPPCPLLWYCTH
ncbi:Uncharacterized protein OBRU01_25013 [Operophtera brumata]|uniref:Uncharacterized protein n=1 Tax=Operophtera brumata TaxID=104452 RepID=A0A0L7KIW9_OPEBR|nr:Uncharacterized protein OBRU01_25013 [Operophtera brumata]